MIRTFLTFSSFIVLFTFLNGQHFVPAYLSESDNPFNPMNINVMSAILDDMDLEADDEIGTIFEQIKDIISELNELRGEEVDAS